jgi:hypothetical protein
MVGGVIGAFLFFLRNQVTRPMERFFKLFALKTLEDASGNTLSFFSLRWKIKEAFLALEARTEELKRQEKDILSSNQEILSYVKNLSALANKYLHKVLEDLPSKQKPKDLFTESLCRDKKEFVFLDAVIRRCKAIHSAHFYKNRINLTIEKDGDIPPFYGSPLAVQKIFLSGIARAF